LAGELANGAALLQGVPDFAVKINSGEQVLITAGKNLAHDLATIAGEYQYKIKSLDEPHLRGRKKASFAGRKGVWPPDVSFYRENFPCVCELIHTLTAEKGLTLPASQTRILPGSREGEE